jgi:orotidine 5'-phosphate decarboxylase subfamily 1/orotate phosphoribosyltransferase
MVGIIMSVTVHGIKCAINFNNLMHALQEIGSIKTGSFTLKSGIISPIYCDMRRVISFPAVFHAVINALAEKVHECDFDYICGVPYGAVPLAAALAIKTNKPLLFLRKEVKNHGTGQLIEGVYEPKSKVLLIEDVMTSGGSIIEVVQQLYAQELDVRDAIVFLDREQGGKERLAKHDITVHAVCTLSALLDAVNDNAKPATIISYAERAKMCTNKTAKSLFFIMQEKKTNLAVAADVTTKAELLRLADLVGPEICVLKTHIDMITDFDTDLLERLTALAQKHNFLIFEDRKFADIGATVQHQYNDGIYKIAQWADIVNAHVLPGPGIIKGLQEIGKKYDRGLLLIAQMSSAGSLADEHYVYNNVALARQYADFVIGFIAQHKLTSDPRFIHMTPGVQIQQQQDSLGQRYIMPEQAIHNGADIIIVGRGITQAQDPVKAARIYRESAWQTYEQLLGIYS